MQRIPGFATPPAFENVYLSTTKDITTQFDAAVDALKDQRIDTLCLYGGWKEIDGEWVPDLSAKHFERLAKIDEIVEIEVDGSLNVDQLRGVAGIKTLRRIGSWGSTGGMDQEGFAFLLTLPNIKAIGSPGGGLEVSDELKKTRPDVTYYVTDFPP